MDLKSGKIKVVTCFVVTLNCKHIRQLFGKQFKPRPTCGKDEFAELLPLFPKINQQACEVKINPR